MGRLERRIEELNARLDSMYIALLCLGTIAAGVVVSWAMDLFWWYS